MASDPARNNIAELQARFAAHIRNPDDVPLPEGVEERRMQIYRDLFFNNIEGLLSGGFPVLRKLMSDAQWFGVVREFMAHYRCQTPYFLEIGQEFLQWLDSRELLQLEFPFMRDLAHYEWLELALDVSSEVLPDDSDFDLPLERPLTLSRLATVQQYRWPVHRISRDWMPDKEDPVWLVVYRNRADEVAFMEINRVTARLVELLDEGKSTGKQALGQLIRELPEHDPQVVLMHGEALITTLLERSILLPLEG